jgi:serine protease AprX
LRQTLFFILLFLNAQVIVAQDYKFVVRFRDKNDNGFSITNPGSYLSEKSISRRGRQNIPVDSTDLPINESYIDSIAAIPSAHILNRSRWLNQILVSYPDSSLPDKLLAFSFVSTTEPVNNTYHKKISGIVSDDRFFSVKSQNPSVSTAKTESNQSDYYNYGTSKPQVSIHHGEYLHNLGYHGEGMTIAILDAGFYSYLSNPAFDSLRMSGRILGTYDYVNQKVSVNEEDGHGANCFSIIAANIPGTMVGTAPAAKYWLFKTEDVSSETPVEEQNWIAAAEFADSAGVDLITTSLGYDYFDDSMYNLNYAQRNGHSAAITRNSRDRQCRQ